MRKQFFILTCLTPGNDLILKSSLTVIGVLVCRAGSDKHLCIRRGWERQIEFLENLMRQDIRNSNAASVLVLDPPGSLCDGLMNWLAWKS